MARPPKFNTAKELEDKATAYFLTCDKETPPTVNGLCLALDICRDTLWEYAKKPEFSDAVKRVRATLEMAWEQRLAGNSVAGAIFWLKNQGWSDKIEQQITGADGGPVVSRIELIAVRPDDDGQS